LRVKRRLQDDAGRDRHADGKHVLGGQRRDPGEESVDPLPLMQVDPTRHGAVRCGGVAHTVGTIGAADAHVWCTCVVTRGLFRVSTAPSKAPILTLRAANWSRTNSSVPTGEPASNEADPGVPAHRRALCNQKGIGPH
jgi:hypothetical protein